MKTDETFKILMLGEGWIKKALLSRHINKPKLFEEDLSLTIGVNFFSKNVEIANIKVKLQLWNFRSEKKYKFLFPQYVKGAEGLILFFDFADRRSFENLCDWINLVRKNAVGIPILLVGNKRYSNFFTVSHKEVEKLIEDFKLNYIETSVVSKEGASEIFNRIAKMALDEKSKR